MTAPQWLSKGQGRHFETLTVTTTLSGPLQLGVHTLVGRKDGPTLGLIGCVHGDETLPPMAYKTLLDDIEPSDLSGRLVIVPAANPMALAVFDRQTPEQHGNTDLHTVFPGNPEKGNLTNKIAIALREGFLDHLDAFVDFHSGGSGGRLQNRSDFDDNLPQDLRDRCIALCRAFGAPFIHANNLAKTATSWVNQKGVPTCNAEVGGAYLSADHTGEYLKNMVDGLKGIMIELGMLKGEVRPPRQCLFGFQNRVEVNPGAGGFLWSEFQSPHDLGQRISQGTVLGRLVDLHTLAVVEELTAPVDGYLFFSRYSGVVDAGTKAFALAEASGVQWLE
jgi:predicted deacylase